MIIISFFLFFWKRSNWSLCFPDWKSSRIDLTFASTFLFVHLFILFGPRVATAQPDELLRWVCLMLARINWCHMARWQDHSIFCVPEHHINHFFFLFFKRKDGKAGYSLPFITQEFPNGLCLLFPSHMRRIYIDGARWCLPPSAPVRERLTGFKTNC